MERGRAAASTADVVVHGPIHLHLVAGYAEVDGVRIELQPKQFHLLAYLMRNAERPIASEEFWTHVFGYRHALCGSHVRRQIMELRRRLGSAGALIRTARSGYFLADSPGDGRASLAAPVLRE
jgi:two-component system, OmpR family, response regulator